jgi:magnesium transporter
MARRTSKAIAALVETYLREYPGEAALHLEGAPPQEVARLLADLPGADAAAVVDKITPDLAGQVIACMPDDSSRTVLTELDPGRAATVLARLDEESRDRKLRLLDSRLAAELRELMAYPPDTAGRLMDAQVTTFRPETAVSQALVRLRAFPRKRIHDVFIVDESGRLSGSVPIRDLAVSAPDARLRDLMHTSPFVQAFAPREDVVEILTRFRLSSLPVVDLTHRLVGLIRHDALVAAATEEASADVQTMVGASKEERALSKVSFAVRKRLPWLEVNLGTAFLAAAVVGIFEDTIARFTALAVLLPVVAGQSGNTGAQALAVVMRGLALREVRVSQWARLVSKEALVGLTNGVAVALTTSSLVYVWSRSLGLALVIGLSMILSMAVAGLAGAAIPVILTSLEQDPAQSSSIVLTTVTDVAGFFSFLGIATLLSGML